ncbi:Hint domain-containing protein [Roseinatronobacter sp. S2]|uniref:Hint domain-containing protein n=1 Tax=Roseinatronobacter sp. S2 TaxID=3035471 RepID=UPI0024108CCD|nr:Hint domain-containing protein [Roseinatronobacter sp. S2]WFE73294.1 Hint domain-containing protein [Roseinatronobacter sp. S2]
MSGTKYECEVFSANDFVVSWGINEGDALGPPETCALGDIYYLKPNRTFHPLTLHLGTTITVVEDHAHILPGNTTVSPLCQLRFMAQDGDILDVILLAIDGRRFGLPLSPIRAGTSYSLIDIDTTDTALRLSEIVHGCFGAGTRVTMADGSLVPIEQLDQGDMVLTRDHGAQPVRWLGKVTLRGYGAFAPVVIPEGGMGNLRSLKLAPRQRIFVYQRGDKRLGHRAEVLLQAHHLVGSAGITQNEGGFVDYYSLAFDAHQIIYAEGVPMESMLVSRAAVTRLPAALKSDLEARYPNLNHKPHFAQEMSSDMLSGPMRDMIFTRS